MRAGSAPESGSDTMEGVLAAILESGDPERLYTGLSLLVSAASAGEEARGLATFGALGALLDPELEARARTATHVVAAERDAFARTLVELRATAAELPNCRIWACAAAVQTTGATVTERLEGVLSTPSFLREVAGARLVVV
jgi:peroxiredoxin family protein